MPGDDLDTSGAHRSKQELSSSVTAPGLREFKASKCGSLSLKDDLVLDLWERAPPKASTSFVRLLEFKRCLTADFWERAPPWPFETRDFGELGIVL